MSDDEGLELLKIANRAMEELKDWMNKPVVPLDDRFLVYEAGVSGLKMVAAPPWVHSIYMGERDNARLIEAYEKKTELAQKYQAEGRWYPIVHVLAERPYRVEVFNKLAPEMSDEEYWDILGSTWIDCENVWQNLHLWRKLLTANRPKREFIMDDDEREALEALPDPIRVYHGVDGSKFAWTTERKTAEWFARRFQGHGDVKVPTLISGYAPKDKVIAHFTRRGEDEILILPSHVKSKKKTRLGGVREDEGA